jgi:hypothetical protein
VSAVLSNTGALVVTAVVLVVMLAPLGRSFWTRGQAGR